MSNPLQVQCTFFLKGCFTNSHIKKICSHIRVLQRVQMLHNVLWLWRRIIKSERNNPDDVIVTSLISISTFSQHIPLLGIWKSIIFFGIVSLHTSSNIMDVIFRSTALEEWEMHLFSLYHSLYTQYKIRVAVGHLSPSDLLTSNKIAVSQHIHQLQTH